MKVSAIVTVLIASSAFVAGAALERATHATAVSTPAAPVRISAVAPKVAPQRSASLVVLPEVTVRPSAEDIALAYAQPVATAASVPDSPLPPRSGAGRGSFDMPYYSFGKVLPQVSQD
ncbi:hypothetical protein [Tahibacter harae]|uniref:Uncharacterized protein n=1 Tax=Tahibacter harae TaxID=2963937 RepID=A0ABT1QMG8_9GAMM|nr:hypothetical protein [Tahibacter harae]MCQ4163708.1 hypothetical protein [Tahibacter harae]